MASKFNTIFEKTLSEANVDLAALVDDEGQPLNDVQPEVKPELDAELTVKTPDSTGKSKALQVKIVKCKRNIEALNKEVKEIFDLSLECQNNNPEKFEDISKKIQSGKAELSKLTSTLDIITDTIKMSNTASKADNSPAK